jgi:diphthamide biosynthesis methyltransferase
MGAVAICGLQLYQFGYTVSIPLFEGEVVTSIDMQSDKSNAKPLVPTRYP